MVTDTKIRRVDPDIAVVEISGRLSLGNTLMSIENSIKRVIDEGTRKLVVDLSALNSIDSSGIGMLVSCYAHMEQKDGFLRIAGAHGGVAQVFQTVHLDRIVPLDADAESARANF